MSATTRPSRTKARRRTGGIILIRNGRHLRSTWIGLRKPETGKRKPERYIRSPVSGLLKRPLRRRPRPAEVAGDANRQRPERERNHRGRRGGEHEQPANSRNEERHRVTPHPVR